MTTNIKIVRYRCEQMAKRIATLVERVDIAPSTRSRWEAKYTIVENYLNSDHKAQKNHAAAMDRVMTDWNDQLTGIEK